MMIKRAVHDQETPMATWEIQLPEGGVKGRPLAAYGENGNSLGWDSWRLQNNVLQVDFGLDPLAGTLEYEYQTEEAVSPPLDASGGVINLTVNQYNGGVATSPVRFQ